MTNSIVLKTDVVTVWHFMDKYLDRVNVHLQLKQWGGTINIMKLSRGGGGGGGGGDGGGCSVMMPVIDMSTL